MRVVLFVVGLIVALNGAVWALQGAYVVPATFMRGPEWIAIGATVFAVGLLMMLKAIARKSPPAPEAPGAVAPKP